MTDRALYISPDKGVGKEFLRKSVRRRSRRGEFLRPRKNSPPSPRSPTRSLPPRELLLRGEGSVQKLSRADKKIPSNTSRTANEEWFGPCPRLRPIDLPS